MGQLKVKKNCTKYSVKFKGIKGKRLFFIFFSFGKKVILSAGACYIADFRLKIYNRLHQTPSHFVNSTSSPTGKEKNRRQHPQTLGLACVG